jgi:hypothetical protein
MVVWAVVLLQVVAAALVELVAIQLLLQLVVKVVLE